ncbi:beta-lactamase family protein [Frankia sp. CNm7]|uniref:Beta-lactamase family protein n=1 Tax=Frankia nepalensis TaxID=1836974 RepID=A0A937R5I3_9ACTN|nr:beta-lactamase family protein [Frankia nepalensis]MBL7512057.1 beta-lactamase family protein [Frankia nepalensis]MBL7521592.1 beta-lactamase family protein [Frankia nepalensis]MBL7625611.1 beta-lactamase family protein [Frankia nepalensis]
MGVGEVHGVCPDRFELVRLVLDAQLEAGDVGTSVAVFVDGEPVVDLWGGYVDEARTVPWSRDTIVNVWSTTKTMTALCALIAADRGLLDLDAPVARYWPEFAAAGKENVLVRHTLAHTAGLPSLRGPHTIEDLYDWPAVTAGLAAQAPEWEPGTAAGYHSLSQGYLVGEVLRRATGRTLGAFFADEVAGPLGLDFHIGLPAEHDGRVSPVIPPPSEFARPPGDAARDAGEADEADEAGDGDQPRLYAAAANTTAWRRAEIPAANGHGNARSIAAALAVLASGGVSQGVRLLSPAGCARAWEEQFHGVDRVLGGGPVHYGMGFRLEGRAGTWGGWGGSVALFDPDHRMAMAFAMNRMRDADTRGLDLILAVYDGLGL